MISVEEFERAASVVPTDRQYALLELIAAARAAGRRMLLRHGGLLHRRRVHRRGLDPGI